MGFCKPEGAGSVHEQRSSASRYAVAVGAILAATAVAAFPARLGEALPLLLLNGAVVVGAWYGGRGPAVAAVVLASAIADYAFLPPYGRFERTPSATVCLAVFIVETSLVAALTTATTESWARARAVARRCVHSEEQLRKLNRTHRALSATNEALVRAEDEDVLLEEICRAIVEVAGYRMCWVGRADHDEARTVRPIARAGFDDGYIDGAEVTWADCERGRGPVGTAIRTSRAYVPQDVEHDAAFTPWRVEARKRGYASVIALPLRSDCGGTFGALAIYAAEREAFDADAVRLLTDLANDLAYGISALRARDAIVRERARFESTIMQAPIAIGVYSGPDHVVRMANRRWLALGLGVDAVGRPLRESLPEAYASGAFAALDEAFATGEPREVLEEPIQRALPDGSVETRFYNVSHQPLYCTSGIVTGVIAVIQDVTDLVNARRAQEEARAAAEQMSRAKDEFLRLASHELRTPLTPILGWTDRLRKTPACPPDKLQRGLDTIYRCARAEAQIVDDLIDVSRIAAGTMSMEERTVELGPLVRACVDEARADAAAKGVEIQASIAEDVSLRGDAGRLAQVAQNLLSNAVKFTPRGGHVTVDLARRDGALVLAVRDDGKGMPPSELPHVFEPFQTGDASVCRPHGGLGLGLAIVRHVVEAHGGVVRAESAGPGRGATFTVELPESRRDRGASRGAEPPTDDARTDGHAQRPRA